jgi:NADH dehydrogenase [ubiquinone] 1 alpha subcomplex assembly factor 7
MSLLEDELSARIQSQGPIPLDQWMAACNQAYYAKGLALGASGDFITAPEISQVFGELAGAWCAVVWQMLGCPQPFSLIELGPGRGTLMADMLRAAPALKQASGIHLIETSPALRQAQGEALKGLPVFWHERLEDAPEGPCLVIANEFFDALPIRQTITGPEGQAERRIGLDGEGRFVFLPETPGIIEESCPAGLDVIRHLAAKLARHPGAALIFDYGYARSQPGDTLQAVRRHAFHPPLSDPGQADLTAHVDFEALKRAAEKEGAGVCGPLDQGVFLARLGIEERTRRLAAAAKPGQATLLVTGTRRLIAPSEMGTLFKALALVSPQLAKDGAFLPGFEVS